MGKSIEQKEQKEQEQKPKSVDVQVIHNEVSKLYAFATQLIENGYTGNAGGSVQFSFEKGKLKKVMTETNTNTVQILK